MRGRGSAAEALRLQPLPHAGEEARGVRVGAEHLRRQTGLRLDERMVRVREIDDRDVPPGLGRDRGEPSLREPRRDVSVATAVHPERGDLQLADRRESDRRRPGPPSEPARRSPRRSALPGDHPGPRDPGRGRSRRPSPQGRRRRAGTGSQAHVRRREGRSTRPGCAPSARPASDRSRAAPRGSAPLPARRGRACRSCPPSATRRGSGRRTGRSRACRRRGRPRRGGRASPRAREGTHAASAPSRGRTTAPACLPAPGGISNVPDSRVRPAPELHLELAHAHACSLLAVDHGRPRAEPGRPGARRPRGEAGADRECRHPPGRSHAPSRSRGRRCGPGRTGRR